MTQIEDLVKWQATFLRAAAHYFETRDPLGEDMAFWANHQNAENFRKTAATLETQAARVKVLESSNASKDYVIAELQSNLNDICKEAEAQAARVKELEALNVKLTHDFNVSNQDGAKLSARIDGLEAQLDAQREELAQFMMQHSFSTGHGDTHAGLLAELEARMAHNAAIRDIMAERARQQSVEGWTPEHDDEHVRGEIASAAAAYAVAGLEGGEAISIGIWPWSREWWKPKDRRRDLVRAGALIVAEIERLDRANARIK
jgi:uncharacterized coiled-coil protein SlyX